MAVTPRIKLIFTILDPSALPNAKSGFPSLAAIADTTISGAEVPKPTMTIPIKIEGKPAWPAVDAAPSTKRSALHTSKANPAIIAAIAKTMTEPPRYQYLKGVWQSCLVYLQNEVNFGSDVVSLFTLRAD